MLTGSRTSWRVATRVGLPLWAALRRIWLPSGAGSLAGGLKMSRRSVISSPRALFTWQDDGFDGQTYVCMMLFSAGVSVVESRRLAASTTSAWALESRVLNCVVY